MRIGLDIDNVVTNFDKKILEEFYKEDKKKRNKGIVNPEGNWINNMFDWSEQEENEFYTVDFHSGLFFCITQYRNTESVIILKSK